MVNGYTVLKPKRLLTIGLSCLFLCTHFFLWPARFYAMSINNQQNYQLTVKLPHTSKCPRLARTHACVHSLVLSGRHLTGMSKWPCWPCPTVAGCQGLCNCKFSRFSHLTLMMRPRSDGGAPPNGTCSSQSRPGGLDWPADTFTNTTVTVGRIKELGWPPDTSTITTMTVGQIKELGWPL